MSDPLLAARGIRKVFGDGEGEVVAVRGVDVSLTVGEPLQ